MNFKSEGLFITVIILISLLIICHISNFMYEIYNKNKFANLPLSISSNPIATKYNTIYYDNQCTPSPCNQQNEAAIPCSIISSCSKNPTPTPTQTKLPYKLSDSEMAVVYRDAYNSAGRELLRRALNEISTPTATSK